jgi:PPOX class probable FMN-dependent enzyme
MPAITTQDELRALYGAASERSLKKQLGHLDVHCRSFIALSPYVVLCTADVNGNLDASPRGGEPGFCRVAADRQLLIPDRPGNNRLDSFSNIVANGRIGLLFFVPGVDELLRVNGTAQLRTDPELLGQCIEQGKPPRVVVSVTVEEAYLHCAKSIMRGRLWDPTAINERSVLPTMGQMLRDQTNGAVELESQEAMAARYRPMLY